MQRYLGARRSRPMICLGDPGDITPPIPQGLDAIRPVRFRPVNLGQIPLSVIVPIGLVLRKASGLGVVDCRKANVPE